MNPYDENATEEWPNDVDDEVFAGWYQEKVAEFHPNLIYCPCPSCEKNMYKIIDDKS